MMGEDWGMRARREQSKAHPVAREVIEAMLPQLVIVLVARLGGEITIPIPEIDATGDRNLTMSFDEAQRTFTFKTERKK